MSGQLLEALNDVSRTRIRDERGPLPRRATRDRIYFENNFARRCARARAGRDCGEL